MSDNVSNMADMCQKDMCVKLYDVSSFLWRVSIAVVCVKYGVGSQAEIPCCQGLVVNNSVL